MNWLRELHQRVYRWLSEPLLDVDKAAEELNQAQVPKPGQTYMEAFDDE